MGSSNLHDDVGISCIKASEKISSNLEEARETCGCQRAPLVLVKKHEKPVKYEKNVEDVEIRISQKKQNEFGNAQKQQEHHESSTPGSQWGTAKAQGLRGNRGKPRNRWNWPHITENPKSAGFFMV